MEPVPCLNCQTFFVPRNKLQRWCSKPNCQKARKACWQKQKLASDPDYKHGQCLAHKKWLQNRPGYWQEYRRKHPDKVQRNRMLQKVRDHRKSRENTSVDTSTIIGLAKMDARKPSVDKLAGEYWLTPSLAKMDAVKIFIAALPGD